MSSSILFPTNEYATSNKVQFSISAVSIRNPKADDDIADVA